MTHFRFDGFVLSPDKLSLYQGDVIVRLEPRLTELLVFLVERRDRVVTKDELIEGVWQGRFVGDSAISRAIYEVRRGLGDDSKSPRFVRTVHGRGYQFIGIVEAEQSGRGAEYHAESEVAPVADVADSATDPADRSRGLPRRLPRGGLWVALGLVVLLLLVTLAVVWRESRVEVQAAAASPPELTELTGSTEPSGPAEPSGPTEPSEPRTLLALSPILVSEHSPELQLIALSLSDLLYQRLQEIPGLSVRAPAYGALETQSMESLAEYASMAGADHLLVGNLSPGVLAGTIRVELELVDFEGGRSRSTPLGPMSIRPPASGEGLEEFLVLRDAIVREVLRVLGDAFLVPGPDSIRPTNYSAYRLFLLAHQAILDGFCDGSGALELLERSLEEDPGYAPAWTLLAAAHTNQVWACGASADHYTEARKAIERAIELAPDYVAPRVVENLILVETGDVERAYERVTVYLAENPGHTEVVASKLYSLRHAGFLSVGEETIGEILEIDPFYFARGASGESPNTLLYLRKYDRFLETLPDSGAAIHLYYRGLAEMLNGEPDVARELLAPAFRNHPADVFARYSEALVAVLDGEPEEAALIVDQIVRQRDQLQAVDGEMSFKEAQLYVLSGELGKGMTRLERSVDQGFFCPRCLALDPLLEPLHADPRFVGVLESASERHLAFARRFGLEPDLPD
jgi:DNA-binding winged helix-turn-helix (wHTH) protein/tetratricopeptide (TPR) repeat protein